MKDMVENKADMEIAENLPYIDGSGNLAYKKITSEFCLCVEQNIKIKLYHVICGV